MGKNKVEVVCTSLDGTVEGTYSFEIVRLATEADALLAALIIEAVDDNGAKLSPPPVLTPLFDPESKSYR